MEHDARHIHLAPGALDGHSLGKLIQSRFAGSVAVPSTQPVVCDAAHPGTHVSYDRRLLPAVAEAIY